MNLHVANDSKSVFRISIRYAALSNVNMEYTVLDPDEGKKISKETETSAAQKTFVKEWGTMIHQTQN